MPNVLGLYVVFFYAMFWVFLFVCGLFMTSKNRIHDWRERHKK